MKIKVIFPLILVVSLSSCMKNNKLEFVKYVSNVSFDEIKKDEVGEGYVRSASYQTLSYYNNKQLDVIDDYRDVYSSGFSYMNAPSLGNIYALVIPVNFKDSSTKNNDKQKIMIQNAFFGEKKKTTFESLSSFYDYSSYGQLEVDGFVTDFYNYPKSSNELGNGTSTVSRMIGGYALNWFYKTYKDLDTSLFDQDKDGYIDCLFIVYNHEVATDSQASSSLWWAYADHMSKKTEYNNVAPYGNAYCWLSYSFLEGNKNLAETHVAIHESGHLFGLTDYYNTDIGANYQPTGYSDMMDRNIGDHTGFSKMLLNWTTPYVVNGSGTITLKPFNNSGDLLLIPSSKGWNGTPYDEYLLLEFYTPEGINKTDAGTKYYYVDNKGNKGVFTFLDKMGLKVYHVDARLGYFDLTSTRDLITVIDDENAYDKIKDYQRYFINFINDNAVSDTNINNESVLYHLLQVGGNNTLINNIPFEAKDLWQKGDSFGIDTFADFTFNNSGELNYTFTVDEMTKEGVTISFTNN